MVIKTLTTHLYLARSSQSPSQPSSRSVSTTAQSSAAVGSPSPPAAAPSAPDYYLSDDKLVSQERERMGRSRSSGGTARGASANHALPSNGLAALASDKLKAKRPLSLAPSLSLGGRSRPSHSSVSSMTTGASTNAPTVGTAAAQAAPSSTARPLLAGLLSGSNSGRATPASNGAQTPVVTPVPTTFGLSHSATVSAAGAHGLVSVKQLEASYVSKVGTRLRELVNKVFPANVEGGLVWQSRPAPRVAVATELGEVLGSELTLSRSDPYVLRSLLRAAVVPALTVLLSRLDPLLPSPSSDPTTFLSIPRSSREADALPLGLRYGIEVVRSALAIKASLDSVVKGEGWEDSEVPRGLVDGLKPFIQQLDAIIQRLMGPYLAAVRSHVTAKISRCRLVGQCATTSGAAANSSASSSAAGKALPLALTKSGPTDKANVCSWLPTSAPEHLRDLAATLEVIRKIFVTKLGAPFSTVTGPRMPQAGVESEEVKKWVVGVASQAVWKGMLAYAARPVPMAVVAMTLDSALPGSRGAQGVTRKQPPSPKGARNLLRGGKRSPSPPLPAGTALNGSATDPAAAAARAAALGAEKALRTELGMFSSLMNKFVEGIAGLQAASPIAGCSLPECRFCACGISVNDPAPNQQENLVVDAMNEALEALSACELIIAAASRPADIVAALRAGRDAVVPVEKGGRQRLTPSVAFTLGPAVFGAPIKDGETLNLEKNEASGTSPPPKTCTTLIRATEEIPPLILLHALASRLPSQLGWRLPHEVWNDDWAEYESELRGFVKAEEWTADVAFEMVKESARVLAARNDAGSAIEPVLTPAVGVLEALCEVGEVKAGVMIEDVAASPTGSPVSSRLL